ncbi:PASTA domain-containing protein [Streptomyces sp. NPDC085596]|uniref:PASTA domain-containing protein n=1 Tax=Streptomyces sp. NPDC085596 TaxID=3365731 RepID=UPI0037CD51B0
MNRPGRPQAPVRVARKAWLKGVGAGVLICALVTGCGSGGDEKPVAAKPRPTVTVTATVTATPALLESQVDSTVADATGAAEEHGYRVAAHDASEKDASPADDWKVCFEKYGRDSVDFGAVASGAPCPKVDGRPIPWPAMPGVVGRTYSAAATAVGGVTKGEISVKASYKDERVAGEHDDWKVCFQSPVAGTKVVGDRDVTLWLTKSGCPSATGTYKDKTNDPNYTPPVAAGSGGSSSSSSSSSSSGSSGSSGGSSSSSSSSGGGGGSAGTTCEIVSNAGNCYNAGQFCRNADVGSSTHAGNGRLIYCRSDGSRNRWNY